MNPIQQQRILHPEAKEIEETKSLFGKIVKLVDKTSEKIGAQMYKKTYDSYEKKLGSFEANYLMNQYTV